jgi:hypothetical protein
MAATRPVPHQSSRGDRLSSSDLFRMRPDKIKLIYLLAEISYKWNLIGIVLGVDLHIIEGLRHNERDNLVQLARILEVWMDKDEIDGAQPMTPQELIDEDISSIPVVPDQSSREGQLSSSDVLRMRPELRELLRLLAPISHKWECHMGDCYTSH